MTDKDNLTKYNKGDGVRGGLDEETRKFTIPQVNNCLEGAKYYAGKKPPDEKRANRAIDSAQRTLDKARKRIEDDIGDRDPGLGLY